MPKIIIKCNRVDSRGFNNFETFPVIEGVEYEEITDKHGFKHRYLRTIETFDKHGNFAGNGLEHRSIETKIEYSKDGDYEEVEVITECFVSVKNFDLIKSSLNPYKTFLEIQSAEQNLFSSTNNNSSLTSTLYTKPEVTKLATLNFEQVINFMAEIKSLIDKYQANKGVFRTYIFKNNSDYMDSVIKNYSKIENKIKTNQILESSDLKFFYKSAYIPSYKDQSNSLSSSIQKEINKCYKRFFSNELAVHKDLQSKYSYYQ